MRGGRWRKYWAYIHKEKKRHTCGMGMEWEDKSCVRCIQNDTWNNRTIYFPFISSTFLVSGAVQLWAIAFTLLYALYTMYGGMKWSRGGMIWKTHMYDIRYFICENKTFFSSFLLLILCHFFFKLTK